ncbi:MAG: DUF4360 domain-containing protein [Oligoflexus sp.]|nr:DUF4360 domain-containing protein [Oligoflexus sp.]
MKVIGNRLAFGIKSLTSLAFVISSSAFATSKPAHVLIESILVKGSGCPSEDTVAVNISDDKEAFTLTFSDFQAESGPGFTLSEGRKNCVLTLNLDIPSGWQFSIASFYYRGFMTLDKGTRATHTTSYSFEGQGTTGVFSASNNGPHTEDYVYADKIGIASAVWSPCTTDRALNINTSIRVYNTNKPKYPESQGYIANDSIDGTIKQIWGISWRKC